MTIKKALLRGLIGIPIGVFISTTISLLISIIMGGFGGNYYSVVAPELTKMMGGELNAVVLQYSMSCVLGFAFAMASAIFEIETWSMTKQTIVHFLITATAMLPIAYICRWVEPTVISLFLYFAVFAVTYFFMWIVQKRYWKKKIAQMNDKLQKNK